ncbi:3-deoxy-D-manno-octulosonic acid transferase [Aureibacter tunicatorum]|uniref:3-deoxy-D-manno-octulosonic acid transferase n=1 Tax=Aureibacter tunicatorum TaxID=866807 RepID=A0AAE3XL85_9BACT|nr:glycosyltransferase N-terminal domain-containing protein [Aureibacter tunicatorum]MDR6238049.1 3-deoxy-D-manno-octulosonic-acid transferase [Aureibacter tunicatorum]
MQKFLYDIFILLLKLGTTIGSLFNAKLKLFVNGRAGTFSKLEDASFDKSDQVAWFHCASLGEFEQARPVLEAFKEKYPDFKIALSFFSPSGYEVRKNYDKADVVFYLPYDTKANAVKLLDMLQPRVVFFVKYDFWYHALREVNERNIPLVLFSAIFRESQPFFKNYGGLHRGMLTFFDEIFVQNEDSKQLLESININHVKVGGDTRCDRVEQIRLGRNDIPVMERFKAEDQLMVVGSSWPSDIEVLAPFMNSMKNKPLKFAIAPHNLKEHEIVEMERLLAELNPVRYSSCNEKNDFETHQVIVIDNFGMLSSLYGYAELAYVGGAFNKGLHNTLEAAVFGIPVFWGDDPTNDKFQEAKDLLKSGGGVVIKDSSELSDIVNKMIEKPELAQKAGKASRAYLEKSIGATDLVMEYINKKL